MMLNPESYSSGHFRFNIKAVALGTMTVVAMVMLWWMYEEQRQIEKYSHVTPGDEAVMKRALEVCIQTPSHDRTSQIIQKHLCATCEYFISQIFFQGKEKFK